MVSRRDFGKIALAGLPVSALLGATIDSTVNGVHLLENLVLAGLVAARAYEFALILQPLKLKGATGSTVAPTAIR